MVELIMFVGIGFLLAGLLVVGIIPLVHARAVRLTTRRLEALNPISMTEIQADKDLLRAEFAMSTRRLELRVEEIKGKATNHLTEIGKKSEAIGRLKLELGEKSAALFALEAKEMQLADELQNTQAALSAKAGALEETERALASTTVELAEVRAKLPQSFVNADSNRSRLKRKDSRYVSRRSPYWLKMKNPESEAVREWGR
jgi:chromosome segregation ATPase